MIFDTETNPMVGINLGSLNIMTLRDGENFLYFLYLLPFERFLRTI